MKNLGMSLLLTVAVSVFSPRATSQKMVAFVPMSQPFAVAANTTTDKIYVSNTIADTVTVVDGSSNTIEATVPVGKNPESIAVNATTNMVYVGNIDDPSVMVIDGSTNTVVATVPGVDGFAFAINTATNLIYFAASSASGTDIEVLDGTTNEIVAQIPVLKSGSCCVQDVALNSATNLIYAAISDVTVGANYFVVINATTNKLAGTLSFSGVCSVNQSVMDQTHNRLYFSDGVCGGLYVVSGATGKVLQTLPLSFSGPLAVNAQLDLIVDLNGPDMTFIDGRNGTILGQQGKIPGSVSCRSIAANSRNRYYAALYNQSNVAKNGLALFTGPTTGSKQPLKAMRYGTSGLALLLTPTK